MRRYLKIYMLVFYTLITHSFTHGISLKFKTDINSSFTIWHTTFDSIGKCYYLSVTGRGTNVISTGLLKLDNCGNMIWYKKYDQLKGVGSYTCTLLSPTVISLTTDYQTTGNDDKGSNVLVDSSGNIIRELTTKGSKISRSEIIKGNTVNYIVYVDLRKVSGIDNNGNVVWTKKIEGNNQDVNHAHIYTAIAKVNGNLLILYYGGPNNHVYIIEIDAGGNLVHQVELSSSNSPYYRISSYPEGVFLQYNGAGLIEDYGKSIIKLHNDLSIDWTKEFYSTNGADHTGPNYTNGYNFPYTLNFGDGIIYAIFVSYLSGSFRYDMIGMNINTGEIESHYYFDKKIYYKARNDILHGLVLEDSAHSFYRPFLLHGKNEILNSCYINTATNASVKDVQVTSEPISGFFVVNDTSEVEYYASYSINPLVATPAFLCDSFTIGRDSTVCTFKNYFLTVADSSRFARVLWNTGQTTYKINITQPGMYIATIFDACGLHVSDTINVFQNLIQVKDTTLRFCEGDSVFYRGRKYISAGLYLDTIHSMLCDSLQKINVVTLPGKQKDLYDTICEGTIIDTIPVFQDTILKRQWSSQFNCDSTIFYHIHVKTKSHILENIQICRNSYFSTVFITNDTSFNRIYTNYAGCDSLVTYIIHPIDAVYMAIDTSICVGQTIYNQAFYRDTILINSGVTSIGCDSLLRVKITVNPLPNTTVYDSIIDANTIILLANGASGYVWNSKETDSFLLIDAYIDSIYSVLGSDINGCTKTAFYDYKAHDINIHVPDAFSPNNDGINDSLSVFVRNYKYFSIKIYNRWGNLLFESNELSHKWNGSYLGEIQPIDSYIYFIEVVTPSNKTITKKGIINIFK